MPNLASLHERIALLESARRSLRRANTLGTEFDSAHSRYPYEDAVRFLEIALAALLLQKFDAEAAHGNPPADEAPESRVLLGGTP